MNHAIVFATATVIGFFAVLALAFAIAIAIPMKPNVARPPLPEPPAPDGNDDEQPPSTFMLSSRKSAWEDDYNYIGTVNQDGNPLTPF